MIASSFFISFNVSRIFLILVAVVFVGSWSSCFLRVGVFKLTCCFGDVFVLVHDYCRASFVCRKYDDVFVLL